MDTPQEEPAPDPREDERRRMMREKALRMKLSPVQYQDRARIAVTIEERLRQINESLDRLAKSLGPDAPGAPPGSPPR